MALKIVDAVLEDILSAMIATGGPFDDAALFMGVFTAIDDQGQATVLADITQGTGALATRVALDTWGTPYKLQDGRWAVDNVIATFSPASSSEAQTLIGYFLATLATLGTLKAFDYFDNPIPLPDEFAQVSVVLRLTVDPDGRWSQTVVWNG